MNLENIIEKSFALTKIEGIKDQKTLFFDLGNRNILPGSFFMLNYNGHQKPFSVSHYDGKTLGITIQGRGECSNMMINASIGDYFGLTGPLGKPFDTKSHKRFLLIGGGIGTAPIYYLASYLLSQGKDVDVIFGARTKDMLLYTEPIKNNITYYTDDGSYGTKGFVTDELDIFLAKHKYDMCAICGPEKMMAIAANKLDGKIQDIQISMERYMKCGLGLCGSCVLDDIGARVCSDGPVFDYDTLQRCKEFGVYHRNAYGQIE